MTIHIPNRAAQLFLRSRRIRLFAIVAVALAGLAWVGDLIYFSMTHVSVDDARVMAGEVAVSSRLPGLVVHFPVIEGDVLKKGQFVARLYSGPEQRKLKTLEDTVATMRARLRFATAEQKLGQQQFAGGLNITRQELNASRAAEQAAKARLIQAKKAYLRSKALFSKGMASQSRRDQDYYAYEAARADYQQTREDVKVSEAQANNAHVGFLNGVQVPLPPPALMKAKIRVAKTQLTEARSRLAQEKLRIHDLEVRSPINGVVNKTLINQGEYVSAGQPILMMHNPRKLWVEARVKETEIRQLRVGQPVDITVDAYPDKHFAGRVHIIGDAATSEFALLPDPNPSGNFTKITQRIPVRITFDKGPVKLLGPGMMVEVAIDVRAGATGH